MNNHDRAPKQPPHIAGLIDDEDFERLTATELAPDTIDRIHAKLGILGIRATDLVAVHPIKDENDQLVDARYVNIGEYDAGTTIRSSNHAKHGLPDPRDVAVELTRIKAHEVDQGMDVKENLRDTLGSLKGIDEGVQAEILQSQAIDSAIQNIVTESKHMVYGGNSSADQVEQLVGAVYSVKTRLGEGTDANATLFTKVNGLVNGLQAVKPKVAELMERSDVVDETIQFATKRAIDETDALADSITNTGPRDQAITEQLDKLANNMNNLLQDRYGHEVYLTQIKQVLVALETDPYYIRTVPYLRAEGAVEALRKVRTNVDAWFE